MKLFMSFFRPHKWEAILTVLTIMLEVVFELIIPMLMADMIDIGVANGDRHYIIMKGLQMILFALLSLLLGQLCARLIARTSQRFGAELRKAEFAKLQQFSFSNIDHFSEASLITRLTGDVNVIQTALANGCRPGFRSPVMLLMSLAVAIRMNWELALVFFVAAPILAYMLFWIVSHVRPMYTHMQRAVDLVNRVVQENLTAMQVVKAFVRKDYEIEKFDAVNTNLKTVSEQAFGFAVMNMPAMQLVMYGTVLAILWFGGQQIMLGDLQVGELTGFLSYVLQVLNSLMMFSNTFLLISRSLTSWHRISEVLEEKIEITEEQAREIQVERGEIEFRHVSFKYAADAAENVLSDLSFHIQAGQTVGIVGQTGSAKTSLVQLIPRLYEASSGTVLVDGHPVQEYPIRELRESIAMVLQKNTLFSGTVRDNLRWGKEDATQEEIDAVCRIACVDEFIGRLSDGYETELGQGGANVSGGQKQRLCIARAILKHPKVLILDDSTSAVDTATEARIRSGLAEMLPDMTKIIIAQRITSVMHADQILVLEDGRLNDIGTHEELLARNQIYQDIYHSQQEGANL